MLVGRVVQRHRATPKILVVLRAHGLVIIKAPRVNNSAVSMLARSLRENLNQI
jgi:hypothetical protein